MAYTVSWDEGVPVGATTPASDIDIEIQKVKTSLRERLEQVLPDFDTDGVDPKKLSIIIGTTATRPATPDYPGEMFFATETGVLYIGDSTPVWIAVGAVIGDPDTPEVSIASACTLTLASNYTVPNAWGLIPTWQKVYDNGNMFNAGNPERVTFPSTGVYMISTSLVIDPTAGTRNVPCYFKVFRNGVVASSGGWGLTSSKDQTDPSGTTYFSCLAQTSVFNYQVGEYIDWRVENQAGLNSPVVQAQYSRVAVVKIL